MAAVRQKPQKALAESLRAAKKVSQDGIIMSSKLDRKHREILMKNGWLNEILKGWYLFTSPEGAAGSTAWYGGFWAFVKHYLTDRFGKAGFCVSADSSLTLHAGDTGIPEQLVVLTKKASNTKVELIHDTSLLLMQNSKKFPREIDEINGLRVMSLPMALSRISPSYYRNCPENIEIVLKLSSLSAASVSRCLLENEEIKSAERIIGAYDHFGEKSKAKQIKDDLTAAGYHVEEDVPFEYGPKLGASRPLSPYSGRILLMWNSMRKIVLERMPAESGIKKGGAGKLLESIQEVFKEDAYHSLSIEGYQVSEDLIAKIESGDWDPDNSEGDGKQKDALAAKGYQMSFDAVLADVEKVLKNQNPGQVFEDGLQVWYRNLFAPSVKASLLRPEALAGYRNLPVFIKEARHVPPSSAAVPDCMETLFELLKNEESAAVRAVLGHFIFVFIHPYMDGNGRIGRFLMNLMLVSGGYDWGIIKVSERNEYMASLETASAKGDIGDFARFVARHL